MAATVQAHKAGKSVVLDRIRQALEISQIHPAPEVSRGYEQVGKDPAGSEAVVAEMVEKLEDYKARVAVVTQDTLEETIREFLAECKSVVVPHGLDSAWVKAAGEDGREVRVDAPSAQLTKDELDKTDGVLTASRCAVSLSGTIMLDGEPDQGRRAITLVPDTHVVVLRAGDIYPLVPQAVEVLRQHPRRAVTWIAGPSATSDIELRRVDGVHGPRNLGVIIVR